MSRRGGNEGLVSESQSVPTPTVITVSEAPVRVERTSEASIRKETLAAQKKRLSNLHKKSKSGGNASLLKIGMPRMASECSPGISVSTAPVRTPQGAKKRRSRMFPPELALTPLAISEKRALTPTFNRLSGQYEFAPIAVMQNFYKGRKEREKARKDNYQKSIESIENEFNKDEFSFEFEIDEDQNRTEAEVQDMIQKEIEKRKLADDLKRLHLIANVPKPEKTGDDIELEKMEREYQMIYRSLVRYFRREDKKFRSVEDIRLAAIQKKVIGKVGWCAFFLFLVGLAFPPMMCLLFLPCFHERSSFAYILGILGLMYVMIIILGMVGLFSYTAYMVLLSL